MSSSPNAMKMAPVFRQISGNGNNNTVIPVGHNQREGIKYSNTTNNNTNRDGGGGDNPWNGAFTKTFMRGSINSSNDGMDASREKPYKLISKLSAEFIGTLLFIFVGSLSGLYTNPNSNSVIHAAFAHGLTIFVLIASFGHISGGHFNPAVSLGLALSGKMNPLVTVFYWVAQIGGGFCGALIVRFVTTQQQYDQIAGGATIVPNNQLWYQALLVEVILTAFLVQTVLTCAADTLTPNLLAPLAIGMTIALDIFGGATLSGASMNPARSFGPCLVASLFIQKGPGTHLSDPIWSFHFVYWAGPFIGSAMAAMLYRSLLARGNNRVFP